MDTANDKEDFARILLGRLTSHESAEQIEDYFELHEAYDDDEKIDMILPYITEGKHIDDIFEDLLTDFCLDDEGYEYLKAKRDFEYNDDPKNFVTYE